MEGGIVHFPGFNRPTDIDSDPPTPKETTDLKHLVEAAGFFSLPSRVGKPAHGAADYRQYTVTIKKGTRRHTIQITEPVDNADLQRLLEGVEQSPMNYTIR